MAGKPVYHWQHGRGIGGEAKGQAVVFERAKNWTRTYQLQYQSAEHSETLPSRTQRESTKTARVKRLLSVSWKLRFSQVIHWKHVDKKKIKEEQAGW